MIGTLEIAGDNAKSIFIDSCLACCPLAAGEAVTLWSDDYDNVEGRAIDNASDVFFSNIMLMLKS